MKRKFRIDENEVMDSADVNVVPEVSEEKSASIQAAEETADIKKAVAENKATPKKEAKKKDEKAPRVETVVNEESKTDTAEKKVQEEQSETPVEEKIEAAVECEVTENPANEVKIKLNFSTFKREAKSCKKMILIKPSTNENVDLLLKNVYGGMSFNELVNQLLEGWVEDMNNQLNK